MIHTEFNTLLVMFSWQHILTIAVILALILILFFTRKFFIKYKLADRLFRYGLGLLIITCEVILRFMYRDPNNLSYFHNLPLPLCGHLLWLCSIALLSNSERLMRKIYPLCLTGAILSIFLIDDIPLPNEFRFWQYFIIHGGFLLGALYFVFTRRINKFDFKDYGWSSLLLIGMGSIMGLLTIYGEEDPYMVIVPLKPLQIIKDTCGQFVYTLLYIISIAAMMAIYTTITWLCTRNRKEEDENIVLFHDHPSLDWIIIHIPSKYRLVIIFSTLFGFFYLLAVQHHTLSIPLAWIMFAINIIFIAMVCFNEVIDNYEKHHNKKD